MLLEGIWQATSRGRRLYQPSAALTLPSRAGSSTSLMYHLLRLFGLEIDAYTHANLPGSGSSNGFALD